MQTKEILLRNNSPKAEILEFLTAADWEKVDDVPKNVAYHRFSDVLPHKHNVLNIINWRDFPESYIENIFYTIIPPPAPKEYRAYTLEEFNEIFVRDGKFVFCYDGGTVRTVTSIELDENDNYPIYCFDTCFNTDNLFENAKQYNPKTKKYDLPCGMEVENE
jgi:hypothetical protein